MGFHFSPYFVIGQENSNPLVAILGTLMKAVRSLLILALKFFYSFMTPNQRRNPSLLTGIPAFIFITLADSGAIISCKILPK